LLQIDININENRLLKPGENYEFRYMINSVSLDASRFLAYINSIVIYLNEYRYDFEVHQVLPCKVSGSLILPKRIGSWTPIVVLNGNDQYGYPQQIPFLHTRPIIVTSVTPILDARLGRSNWTQDDYRISGIKHMLNINGFDCTTIGKEIQPPVEHGLDFIKFEKKWASGGNCFIAILTPRDISSRGLLSLPPPWVVNETGLSYESDRPHLVFAERGVELVALYQEMDKNHIIEFTFVDGRVVYEKNYTKKVLQFRQEAEGYDIKKRIRTAGQFIFLGFGLYGGWKFYQDFFDSQSTNKKKRKK